MSSLAALCVPATFSGTTLSGSLIQSINANWVTGFNRTVPAQYWYNHESINVTNANFCNVTVTYTHLAKADNIRVTVWMPETWNQRVQAVGGGGWVAGGENFILSGLGLAGSIGTGYATYTTDAGLGDAADASSWALTATGIVNTNNLVNLAYQSLYDEAIIGRAAITKFYGKVPTYSYFTGCSQGGRQGLMLAQKYPDLYDGIASSAPAVNWNAFFLGTFWPQLVMQVAGKYPRTCEMDYINAAAVAACDGLDGVVDGTVTNANTCSFNPFSLVGTSFICAATGATAQVSQIAAEVVNATWTGPRNTAGGFLWHGPNVGSDIPGTLNGQGIASTTCTAAGVCIGTPHMLGSQWITFFIKKNPNFNLTSITRAQYEEIYAQGSQMYSNIIDTNNPNLSAYKASGGKLLGFHGLADALIPWKGTEQYYNTVTALDANVYDFYRMFAVPGLQHCSGGDGGQPTTLFNALVAWVENGTIPNSLPITHTSNGTTFNQIICPYPKLAKYNGGDKTAAASYICA